MGKNLAYVFGVVFILVGILGFFNNPILGLFAVDLVHNIIHIALGVVLIVGAGSSSMTMKIVAVIYLLVAILGFVMGPGKLLNLVTVNQADNWLHLVLAVALFGASMVGGSSSQSASPMPMQQ